MKVNLAQNEKRILTYCDSFPSETTRYVTRLELLKANRVKPLSQWASEFANKYIRSLEPQVSPASLLVKGRRLHGYFNWEIRNGYRKGLNPIDCRTLPKNRDKRSPQVLTESEIQKMLSKIPRATWLGTRDRAAISMMLLCGFRISTVTALNWSDLEKRNDGWVLHTKAKGNVRSSRLVRPDLAKLLLKYKSLTLGANDAN